MTDYRFVNGILHEAGDIDPVNSRWSEERPEEDEWYEDQKEEERYDN